MSYPVGLSFRRIWKIHFSVDGRTAFDPNFAACLFAPYQTVIGTGVEFAIFAFAQGGNIAVNAGTLVFHHRIHAPHFPHDGQGISVDSARQISADGCP